MRVEKLLFFFITSITYGRLKQVSISFPLGMMKISDGKKTSDWRMISRDRARKICNRIKNVLITLKNGLKNEKSTENVPVCVNVCDEQMQRTVK